MKKILVLTQDSDIVSDIQKAFADLGIEMNTLDLKSHDFSLYFGGKMRKNLIENADLASSKFNMPVLSLFTSLKIDALKGWPQNDIEFYQADVDAGMEAVINNKMADKKSHKAEVNTLMAVAAPRKKTLFIKNKQMGHISKNTGGEGNIIARVFCTGGNRKPLSRLEGAEKLHNSPVYAAIIKNKKAILSFFE